MLSSSIRGSFLLSLLMSLGVAIPTSSDASSSLAPRAQYCANAPGVQAGSLFSRHLLRQLPSATLSKRLPTHPYCAQDSKTYVVATMTALFPPSSLRSIAVADLLIDAERFLRHYILTVGDGNLAAGHFEWPGNERLTLEAWNWNNHQLTYGVLAAGLQALQVWTWNEGWGTFKFNVYDGINQVGEGTLAIPWDGLIRVRVRGA